MKPQDGWNGGRFDVSRADYSFCVNCNGNCGVLRVQGDQAYHRKFDPRVARSFSCKPCLRIEYCIHMGGHPDMCDRGRHRCGHCHSFTSITEDVLIGLF